MKLFLLLFLICTSLYGTSTTATVGQNANLTFALQENLFSEAQIKAFLAKSAFFAENTGIAQLDRVTIDQPTKTITIQFRPRAVSQGLSLLPPMSLLGNTLLWPSFQYDFIAPTAATFNEPLLDMQLQPIPQLQNAMLTKALAQFGTEQRNRFKSQQTNLILVLNGLFIALLLAGLTRLCMRHLKVWRTHREQLLADQKTNLELLHALRERTTAWELLHKRLVEYVVKESGQKTEMTPQQLAIYFKNKNQEELAQSALMIQQNAYLPHTDFEPFQQACQHITKPINAK